MKIKFFFIAVALLCMILLVFLGSNITVFQPSNSVNCTNNADCDWVLTNCCKETAGGLWDCVNLKNYKAPECQENVICPQVLSPRPLTSCMCKDGGCVSESAS